MRLVSYLRPSLPQSKQLPERKQQLDSLLLVFSTWSIALCHICLSGSLCTGKPQTRQIARKIFPDFCLLCSSASGDAGPKRGQNLLQLRMIQRIRPSELLSVLQNPEQLHSDPSKQCRGQFLQHFLLIFCKALFVFFVPKCRILCTAVSCTHVAFQRSQSGKNL